MVRLGALLFSCFLLVPCIADEPKPEVKWFRWHTDGKNGYDIVSNFKSPFFGQMINSEREDNSAPWIGGQSGAIAPTSAHIFPGGPDHFGGEPLHGNWGYQDPFFDWASKNPNGKASGSVLIVATTKEITTKDGKTKTDEYGSVRNEHFGDKNSAFQRNIWGPGGWRRWDLRHFGGDRFY